MLNIFKCKHDPNKEECTLVFDQGKIFLTFPPKYTCICSVCKKQFIFTRDEKTQKFTRVSTKGRGKTE